MILPSSFSSRPCQPKDLKASRGCSAGAAWKPLSKSNCRRYAGVGATQKALARGVAACVVPFGRDQLEVARRVEAARIHLVEGDRWRWRDDLRGDELVAVRGLDNDEMRARGEWVIAVAENDWIAVACSAPGRV